MDNQQWTDDQFASLIKHATIAPSNQLSKLIMERIYAEKRAVQEVKEPKIKGILFPLLFTSVFGSLAVIQFVLNKFFASTPQFEALFVLSLLGLVVSLALFLIQIIDIYIKMKIK